MPELAFLRDLVVLFGASIVVVYGFNRLRLPAVVGFLVAGALLGPYGLDVVDDVARVEVFAEVGVVLLLFTIGVEFSLGQLRSLRTVAGAAPPDRLRDRPVCAGGYRLRVAAQPGRVLGLPGGDEQHGGRAQNGDGAG